MSVSFRRFPKDVAPRHLTRASVRKRKARTGGGNVLDSDTAA
jgi:hypothetical protein